MCNNTQLFGTKSFISQQNKRVKKILNKSHVCDWVARCIESQSPQPKREFFWKSTLKSSNREFFKPANISEEVNHKDDYDTVAHKILSPVDEAKIFRKID